MKTTIELPDELLQQVRKAARQEGMTLRAFVEEGLHRVMESRRKRPVQAIDLPTYGGSGVTDEFKNAGWERMREEIYRDRGG